MYPVWDPVASLGILNPDKNDAFTCVGYAPSKGRRCQNPIAACNRTSIFRILDKLSLKDPCEAACSAQLHRAAGLALCRRYHQDQVDNIVKKWQRKIKILEPVKTARTRKAETYTSNDSDDTDASDESFVSSPASDFRRECEEMKDLLERMLEKLEQERRDKNNKMRRKGQGQETGERECQEREEQERREREVKAREEQRKREQERQEQERREREKFEKEKSEREARERAARNERVRRRAQRMREEREREERENAAREKAEWEAVWKRYISDWISLKESKIPRSRETVPWPVKSGHWKDVADYNVREFYQKAPPHVDTPRDAYRRMQAENLKWHTDKAPALFGRTDISESDSMLVNTVAQVVIELRKMAQERAKQ